MSVLNYLNSSYQGRLIFFKVLTDSSVPGVDPEQIPRCDETLNRIGRWINELVQGSPLFAEQWTAPGTFEAKKALDLLEAIKPELRWISDVSSRLANVEDFSALLLDDLRVLTACLTRLRVMSHTYCLFNIKIGESMNLAEYAAYFKRLEPQLSAQVSAAFAANQAVSSPDNTLGASFLDGLKRECAELSPLALTHLHDINLLTARFRGGLSFLTVDFIEQEGRRWLNLGFTPTDAGYWRAYSIEPDEAALWRKAGIELPAVTVAWRSFGFSAPDSATWTRYGFEAWDAARWNARGFT
ncbi:MAG: hypothetical protein RL417_334, partial [Pseudomonadota bacterium]